MKNRKLFLLLVFIAFTLTAVGIQDSPEYKILFEKAKFTMETKGDLKGAINLFSDIIKKYPKEREYAAKSQLYIGLCYEKLGNTQARAAYERVVRDYADQSEVVSQAQIKLSSLNGHGGTKELVTRRVLADASKIGDILTPDGRYISCEIDSETGDIVQFEIASGQTRRIKNRGLWTDTDKTYENQAFSPDGKQIAYDAQMRDGGRQLRIRNMDGSGLHILYGDKNYCCLKPLDWSPDAEYILALRLLSTPSNDPKKVKELVLISTTDGSVRVLKSISSDWYLYERARFSPDGRFFAFSFLSEGNSPQGEVILMGTDAGNEIVIAGNPAEDRLLGWRPDGKSLIFLSDRSGTWDIWSVRINGGKQQGEPELLKKDFGYFSKVLGFTPDGSCYYKTDTRLGGLYSGMIDLQTGKVLVPPALVTTRFTGAPAQLSWSPDGRNLAYISRPGLWGTGNNVLTIRSAATGEERFPSTPFRGIGFSFWSQDGRSIIVGGFTNTESAIFRIDTATSSITKLTGWGWKPRLSPDEKTLVFLKEGLIITKRNIDTGEESEIVKAGRMYYDLSPDGREVVLQKDSVIEIVSLDGTIMRKLLGGLVKEYELKWTRDGNYIIAQTWYETKTEIWRIPVQGGSPLKLELSDSNIGSFTLNPDNQRFAFDMYAGSKSELWVMENFLPK